MYKIVFTKDGKVVKTKRYASVIKATDAFWGLRLPEANEISLYSRVAGQWQYDAFWHY